MNSWIMTIEVFKRGTEQFTVDRDKIEERLVQCSVSDSKFLWVNDDRCFNLDYITEIRFTKKV